jgi:hypothetical protein
LSYIVWEPLSPIHNIHQCVWKYPPHVLHLVVNAIVRLVQGEHRDYTYVDDCYVVRAEA